MNEISYLQNTVEMALLSDRVIVPDAPAPEQEDGARLIDESGLFDRAWYVVGNPDVASCGLCPIQHFLHQGWKEGRNPNPYFDVDHYLSQNPEVAQASVNPLLHYILAGEADGRSPGPLFDPQWYASHHSVAPGQSALAHFLRLRCTGTVSPIPEFDVAYYLDRNRDIAHANCDPFDHFLHYGYREGRDPSAGFDIRFYVHRHLGGLFDQNPVLHYRQWRNALRLHTSPPAHEPSVFDQVRHFTRPGPDFEEAQPLPDSAPRLAKLLAYYLPQFHKLAENDGWWGRGFTEWTAIARGMPRWEGHYQPRIPRDLGHYDLSDTEALRRQIALAKKAGVFGFVQYFYWFNGRRLLDRPLEAMLADASLDFPFCLMWANENWTRRWDGSDQEVLISQDYRQDDDAALIACFARHFADPRYIRLSGRPVLMVYRAGLIPNVAETVLRWRAMFRDQHGCDPILVMAQSFQDRDPHELGFDGAIEFPPHKLTAAIPACNMGLRLFDTAMRGQVYAYDDVVKASLAEPPAAYPLIRTALPAWDNDARREGTGMALQGSTPAKYQAWLEQLVDQTAEHDFLGERIVCVNAWNEWAEGAYLEPDVHFGAAYLNATSRAISRARPIEAAERVLLVGHDAFQAGAQMLLLELGRQMIQAHGVEVEFLLLGGGALQPDYAESAPCVVAEDRAAQRIAIKAASGRGIRHALVNTSAAARAIPLLHAAGIDTVLLVHEMTLIMTEHGLLPGARAGAAMARRVIFPADCVKDAFPARAQLDPARLRVLPQGLYRPVAFDPFARHRLRAELGLAEGDTLVIGAGHGDLRKGFDLFLQAARAAARQASNRHYCWLGAVDPQLASYLGREIKLAMASRRFHLPGFQTDVAGWLSAADAFALTSREDPYPSVVLEALASGLRVAAFAGSGGVEGLLADPDLGVLVPMADPPALAAALAELVATAGHAGRPDRARDLTQRFDFARYTAEILAELRPAAPRISVVVPSHNYARFLPERLQSIFVQSNPVEEIIVLDDGSTDDSLAVAAKVAADWRRRVRVVAQPQNGGSVFAQWRRAADLAQGDYLWIAEADDAAHPSLLARLAQLLEAHPDIDLAFCDSKAVGADGSLLSPDYKGYYSAGGNKALLQDGVFKADSFLRQGLAVRNTILNASAVLFRTEALRQALDRCKDELVEWQVAGDWRLYAELLAHSTGRVGYVAAPLNIHRRHSASATGRLPPPAMQSEIARMHATINALLPANPARTARQARYLASVMAEPTVEQVAHL